MNGKEIKATCDICGDDLYTRMWRKHISYCRAIPIDEINNEYTNDPKASITKLAKKYHIGHVRIRKILMHSFNWRVDDMYRKGMSAKNILLKEAHKNGSYTRDDAGTFVRIESNGPKCECGIIVSKDGERCDWCILESKGIKSYHDMY
jgi:hypothetical protein